jgi:hypothetical protein
VTVSSQGAPETDTAHNEKTFLHTHVRRSFFGIGSWISCPGNAVSSGYPAQVVERPAKSS